MMAQLALRYRNGRLKNLSPFKLDADGVPGNLARLSRTFKPPAKLRPSRGPLPNKDPSLPVMVNNARPHRHK